MCEGATDGEGSLRRVRPPRTCPGAPRASRRFLTAASGPGHGMARGQPQAAGT
jgi:hypothetical protein